MEKAKANHRFALIEEHFYGNPQKRIKGAWEMLLEGEGPSQRYTTLLKASLIESLF